MDVCGQEPSASAARVCYSLIMQPDGSNFVRAFGSEPKSAVIGPFENETSARSWIGSLPNLRRGFEYWRSKRRGDRLPLSQDLDGAGIRELLCNITIADVRPDPFAVCYRVIGTACMHIFEPYRPGEFLSPELEGEAGYAYWMKIYRQAYATKNPHFGRDISRNTQVGDIEYDWMILPIVDERGKVVMTLDMYEERHSSTPPARPLRH
jgi:hypothetical protein